MNIVLPQIQMILRDGNLPPSTFQKVLTYIRELEKLPFHVLTQFTHSIINEIRVEMDDMLPPEQKAIRRRCSFSLKRQMEALKQDSIQQSSPINPSSSSVSTTTTTTTTTTTGLTGFGAESVTPNSSLQLNQVHAFTFSSTSTTITEKLCALFTAEVGIIHLMMMMNSISLSVSQIALGNNYVQAMGFLCCFYLAQSSHN